MIHVFEETGDSPVFSCSENEEMESDILILKSNL